MIVPPFSGVDLVRETPGLGNDAGFVPVTSRFSHPDHPEVYAAGVDVAIAPPAPTPVPAGVPKTGAMSEEMAKVAARNIAADLGVGTHRELPMEELGAICVLDAGSGGMIIKLDDAMGDHPKGRPMSGPQAHWAKVAFERYFLASRRRGFVRF